MRQSCTPLFLLQARTALPHPVPVLKEIAAGLFPPPRLRERLQMSAALSTAVHQQPRRNHFFLPTKKKKKLSSFKNSLFSPARLGIKYETAPRERKIKASDFRRTFGKGQEIIQTKSRGGNKVFVGYLLIFQDVLKKKSSKSRRVDERENVLLCFSNFQGTLTLRVKY